MTPIDYHNPNDYWHGYDPYKGMTDDERMKAGCLQTAAVIAATIVAILLCAMLGSCTTTKYVPVVEHRTDTLLKYSSILDSIYVHDSIYVSDFVRDDTVIKTVERWHTSYRDRLMTDTIYSSVTDTVTVVCDNIKEVPAQLSWWQQARLHLANIVLYLLAVLAVIYVGKRHIKRLMP